MGLFKPVPSLSAPRAWPGILARTALGILAVCSALVQAQSGSPGAVRASAQADNVAVITIHGPIDQYTTHSVKRRMELAEKGGAQALVFEIDTPGGEVVAVLDICDLIKRSPVANTVAWVNTKAYSGGAIIALACKEIVSSDPATLGDALPVTSANGFGMLGELPADERQKMLSPLLAEVVDSARRRGYDEKLVQGIVSRGVELWLVQDKTDPSRRLFIDAAEYRLLFGGEPDRSMVPHVVSAAPTAAESAQTHGAPADPEPLPPSDPAGFIPAAPALGAISEQVNLELERDTLRPTLTAADAGGWTLVEYVSDGQGLIVLKAPGLQRYGLSRATVMNDQDLTAYFGAKNLRRLDPSWSEALTVFLTNWAVRAVLIALFLIGLFLEMTHPGLIVPGAVAGAALIGLLAPPMVVGMANWWEVAAVMAGILLIALEIFVIPGFGFAGVAGLILLFGGLVGTFVRESPGGLFPNSAEARSDLLFGVVSIVLALGTSSIAIYYLGRNFGSLPILGGLVLKDGASDDEASDDFLSAMNTEATVPIAPGEVGTAITPIRPVGRAQFEDRIFDVLSEMAYIRAGERIRVVSAAENRIVVEPAGPESPEQAAGGGPTA
jgi:membrane-bound ClpP family serine protease